MKQPKTKTIRRWAQFYISPLGGSWVLHDPITPTRREIVSYIGKLKIEEQKRRTPLRLTITYTVPKGKKK